MEYKYLPRSNAPTLLFRKWPIEPGLRTSGTRKVVFLGHSQPTHSGMLTKIAEGFRNAGWEAHSGDIRGHGNSTDSNSVLGHLDHKTGWSGAIDDMRLLLEKSFEGTDWEDRLIVVPNITALLTLEVMKNWPDIARHIVLISPPPNQKALALMGKTFSQVRMRLKGPNEPDEQPLHHLYSFLGSHLNERQHPADVMSSDRAIIQSVIDDPLAWPTPTSAYWSSIFNGMLSAWKWTENAQMKAGTRCLVMFGGEDAMLRSGGFLAPIERFLRNVGIEDVASERVDGARSALFLEEERFEVSRRILDWVNEKNRPEADHDEVDAAQLASEVLASINASDRSNLTPDELVELCYNAIDDESRWNEIIFRMIYDAERSGDLAEEELTDRISRLMPHWERAFQLNRQVMMNATLGVLLQSVVDRLQIGVAILDKDGDLLHANGTYEDAIAALCSSSMNEDRQNDIRVAAVTRRLLATNAKSAPTQRNTDEQVLLFEERPVGFQFFPQALKQTSLQRQGPASIVILRAGDAGAEAGETRRVLSELAYGLTGKEAEIALAVASGKSLDEIAGDMEILVSTVRGHLKKAFHKMDVHSQAELAARIMSGPLGWLR
ncbi:MAG: alpha/beta hydrolase [Hoeflea sp.]|uniref:serine aminopeptidase domain-containing protein n=1 Tax=Hoeflea sp. TaxID=1940281 RepID=UPI0032EAA4E7